MQPEVADTPFATFGYNSAISGEHIPANLTDLLLCITLSRRAYDQIKKAISLETALGNLQASISRLPQSEISERAL